MFKTLLAKAFMPLAKNAVEAAENNFGPGKGIAKKRFAMNFILARTPLPPVVREMASDLLVELIDTAIEKALEKQKTQ